MLGAPRVPRVYIAGGEGVLGRALRTAATRCGYDVRGVLGNEPALDNARAVDDFLAAVRPDWVIVAGGRSAGIGGNERFPADLMADNLRADTHVLTSARRHGVVKLLYLAPACIYPRRCPQPMRVEDLMTGQLEPTSEAYALAKLSGLTLCAALRRQHGVSFVAAIGANPFGPGDDFEADTSHVIAALMARMHAAKQVAAPSVTIWGTGRARREFIFADDLAAGCLFLLRHYDAPEPINVGTGDSVSIMELAEVIRSVVGYRGRLAVDPSRPDGTPDKRLDSSSLRALGWAPTTSLETGLAETYAWFLDHVASAAVSLRP
jgi:GDP-L-fucose synthase